MKHPRFYFYCQKKKKKPYSAELDQSVKSSGGNKDMSLYRNWSQSRCQIGEVLGDIYSVQNHCRGTPPYTWYRWGSWSCPRFSSTRPSRSSVDLWVPAGSHWRQSSGPSCDRRSAFLASLSSFYDHKENLHLMQTITKCFHIHVHVVQKCIRIVSPVFWY